MENAAHALRIAGAIIIALLTIAVLVWGLGVIQAIPKAQEKADKEEEVVNFNLQYEAFNKDDLYGTDVISVMNKAIDNNLNSDEKIIIEWRFDMHMKYKRGYSILSTENRNEALTTSYEEIISPGEKFSAKDCVAKKYKCISVEYKNLGGKISKMIFEYIN